MFALLATIFLLVGNAIGETQKYPDIAGTWMCTDKCQDCGGVICKIGQDGGMLTFINECNQGSKGFFEDNKTIRAKEWGVRAIISGDLNQINWENGSVWRRK